MSRVYIVVEGQTEESFVTQVLGAVLWPSNVYPIPILLGGMGGRPIYPRVRKDILVLLKQERTAYCTTMVDFYGLGAGYPGAPVVVGMPPLEKVRRLEEAMKADIVAEVPELRPDVRFLPYLQLHEHEALLFSDPEALARGIYQPSLEPSLRQIRNAFPTPEDIDDSPATAPSKRINALYPGYRKPLHGTLAALTVGIESMRAECPHFRQWVEWLQTLAAPE